MNHELPDVKARFRKGRGTRDQIVNIGWIIHKARELQKNIYFCFIDYTKALDCVDHNKVWKIRKEIGILSSVQPLSSVQLFATPQNGAHQASLPSTTPRIYSNSCPLSRWYHPTISSSVIPFSSCLQSFPASGSFQMSQLFASGDQNIGVSASTSVLPINI